MALPPVLFTRLENGGGEATGYRLLAGTALSEIPDDNVDIGSAQGESGLNYQYQRKPLNHMVRFGNKVFVWVKNHIYEINTSTDSWDIAHTTTTGTPNSDHSGLYHIEINGVPSLIGFYGANVVLMYNGNTDSWSETTLPLSVVSPSQSEVFIYRNIVFCAGVSGGSRVWWWDPSGSSLGTQTMSPAGVSFAVHKGVLYLILYFWASPTQPYMYRFTGASWSGLDYVGVNSNPGGVRVEHVYANAPEEKMPELVDIDGKLYAFVWGRLTGSGDLYSHLEIYEYDATGDYIDMSTDEVRITTSVSPFQSSSSSLHHPSIHVFQDFDTDPTNPETYFFIIGRRDQDSWVTYKWNGPSSLMTSVGIIGAWGLAPSQSKDGGGQRVWTEGVPNVQITGITKSSDGMTISFKAYGGDTGKIVKIYVNGQEGPPTALATLTGTATGGSATRNGNQVENVSADGSTTYTVGWDFFSDGLSIGQYANLAPRIE